MPQAQPVGRQQYNVVSLVLGGKSRKPRRIPEGLQTVTNPYLKDSEIIVESVSRMGYIRIDAWGLLEPTPLVEARKEHLSV